MVERKGAVIKAMMSKSCVLSRTKLYDIIQDEERGMNESSITQEKTTQGTTSLGFGYQGTDVRPKIRHNVLWKGSIVLSLIPVSFIDTIGYCDLDRITPHTIDLCLIIGNTDRGKKDMTISKDYASSILIPNIISTT